LGVARANNNPLAGRDPGDGHAVGDQFAQDPKKVKAQHDEARDIWAAVIPTEKLAGASSARSEVAK